ncbi:MAG: PDZ domain-containing protein, partial [Planctomycetota bacterium]
HIYLKNFLLISFLTASLLVSFGCTPPSQNSSTPKENLGQGGSAKNHSNLPNKKSPVKKTSTHPRKVISKRELPGWLGASCSRYLVNGRPKALFITKVVPHSPAAKAGLQKGDIILGLNNIPITNLRVFFSTLRAIGAGKLVTLTILSPKKGKKIFTRKLQLGTPTQRIVKSSIQRGVAWLLANQRPDGGWLHYASYYPRSSPPMTALVIAALSSLSSKKPEVKKAIEKGLQYILRHWTPSGLLGDTEDKVLFEGYTTSLTLTALANHKDPKYKTLKAKLIQKLKDMQIKDKDGYSRYDVAYGGWNYWDGKKRILLRTDLSLASFVLESLYEAGVSSKDPVIQRGLYFVQQCQNYDPRDMNWDGGFRFSPVESKAGIFTKNGKDYFRSYGSMTADGLRSFYYCGLPFSHPRAQKAFQWLVHHFSYTHNPGFENSPNKDPVRGIRFYYFTSLAKALASYKIPYIQGSGGKIYWASELSGWLVSRQFPKGFWQNRENLMHEDHQPLATSLAIWCLSTLLPYLPQD